MQLQAPLLCKSNSLCPEARTWLTQQLTSAWSGWGVFLPKGEWRHKHKETFDKAFHSMFSNLNDRIYHLSIQLKTTHWSSSVEETSKMSCMSTFCLQNNMNDLKWKTQFFKIFFKHFENISSDKGALYFSNCLVCNWIQSSILFAAVVAMKPRRLHVVWIIVVMWFSFLSCCVI